VAEVAPLANARSRTMTIKIHWADDKNFELPIGASAAVDFILQAYDQTLAVPVGAVINHDIIPYLYLIKRDRAYIQNVNLGIEEKGWVSVDFNWNGTDPVAVTNLNNLSDSSRVFAVPLTEVSK
jgi:hypothetical protein